MSLWNFIKYNVVGGGDSALYGTESATYYLRNGLLNLNIALPLALLAPVLVAFGAWQSKGSFLLHTKAFILPMPGSLPEQVTPQTAKLAIVG